MQRGYCFVYYQGVGTIYRKSKKFFFVIFYTIYAIPAAARLAGFFLRRKNFSILLDILFFVRILLLLAPFPGKISG